MSSSSSIKNFRNKLIKRRSERNKIATNCGTDYEKPNLEPDFETEGLKTKFLRKKLKDEDFGFG